MPMTFKKTVAVCEQMCSIEEAETLLEWLLDNPKGMVNLKKCQYLHTAIIQVLMAIKPEFSALPDDEKFRQTLIAAGLLTE